jgi:hypothetical protein
MADETFRLSRKKITPEDLNAAENLPRDAASNQNPLDSIRSMQEAVAKETGKDVARPFDSPFEIGGNVPPEFRAALQGKNVNIAKAPATETPVVRPKKNSSAKEEESFETFEAPPERARSQKKATPDSQVTKTQGSDQLENLLGRLAETHQWEPFAWPSRGKFYENIPEVVGIRAMTGEEEQILATPRFVKRGKAIDMIFRRCIRENINTEELLSADRTHLLIYLRGISYTPEYDVEIKCPNCTVKFPHVIDLNEIEVESCPDEFGPDNLSGTLPASGFHYGYRLATGQDEQEIQAYRERRVQQWGDQGEDDTLLYRTALLLEEIEGVTMKKELAVLLKKLPIQDVAYLRNEINTPPFGVDTQLPIMCPSCNEDFKIDLPLEANFFFPRKKPERIQA